MINTVVYITYLYAKQCIQSLVKHKKILTSPLPICPNQISHHSSLGLGVVHMSIEKHSCVIVRRLQCDGQSIASILQKVKERKRGTNRKKTEWTEGFTVSDGTCDGHCTWLLLFPAPPLFLDTYCASVWVCYIIHVMLGQFIHPSHSSHDPTSSTGQQWSWTFRTIATSSVF